MVSKLSFEGRLKLTLVVGLRLIKNTLDKISFVSCRRSGGARVFQVSSIQGVNGHGFLHDICLM